MTSSNTQFAIAVHILAGLDYRGCKQATSSELAESVNACPSFVRRVLAKLSKAGLVRTTVGKGGSCSLVKRSREISLYEVYQAVDSPPPFTIHNYKDKKACPVSCNIKEVLEGVLQKSRRSVEDTLKKISIADVVSEMR